MKRLKRKVAIVTGGAMGVGRAIAIEFAREGAKIVVVGLPDEPVEEVVDQIEHNGGLAIGFKLDVSIPENARKVIKGAVDEWGRLNILVNAAGVVGAQAELQQLGDRDIENVLSQNIKSTIMMTKYGIPELQKNKGSIISAGCVTQDGVSSVNAPYAGTKGFIHAFMQGTALEQAKYGVRANCVCLDSFLDPVQNLFKENSERELARVIPTSFKIEKVKGLEDIAGIFLFLASDEAGGVTGATLTADGGITTLKGMVNQPQEGIPAVDPEAEFAVEYLPATSIVQPSIH
jgi:NAD(P)-dependent dehydrogenase (short-subunit alcohol dehydrogenase family)